MAGYFVICLHSPSLGGCWDLNCFLFLLGAGWNSDRKGRCRFMEWGVDRFHSLGCPMIEYGIRKWCKL